MGFGLITSLTSHNFVLISTIIYTYYLYNYVTHIASVYLLKTQTQLFIVSIASTYIIAT